MVKFTGMENQWTIGHQKNTFNSRFRGKMASLLIFNEAITPAQAHNNHNYIHGVDGGGGGDGGNNNTVNNVLDQTWYRDLDYISKVNIVNNSGNKYVLNGYSTYINDVVYRLNIGTYHIKDIPQAHPMAILNNGIEDKISYKGLLTKKISKNVSSSTADGDYDFYWGDITITVHSITQCSIYCYHHGYGW